ncbi:hypothetical protein JR316_0001528 [Psilocybe cubensis]|uniref:Uncharacterized protein n=2 Tax=Psilocybe cubensis TaxID=181762 RepID=A0ACB8HI60_PSICU|nr:hypothetical protein JR316_0001528 [Psilocybe cubensis]KAH9487452.1 hypothetical protein JR316_0001528 [Psilocybe cubensis]
MTSTFLSRSGKSPLHLDITFAPPDARLGLSWIQKTRYEESIRRVLFSHIGRCQSLRVESDEFIITTILDLFLDFNLSPSNNSVYTPLSRLHLAKTISASPVVSDPPDYGHQQPTFPPDLSVVAPHLTHLYVDGVQVAVFPRWSLERLYLTDLFVSYQNHFHIFMKTRVTTLVLHRVTIPGGIPYVRQILTYHPSSVTSLRLSELRCAGPENEHQDIYALFFTLTPYRTLHDLELCGLSEDAMYGLTRMLMSNSELVFSEMRLLTLRNVKLIDTMVVPLTNATPGLNGLVLDSVGGGSRLLEVWRRHPGIWPQMTEVSMGEGESVQVRNGR